MLLSEGLMGPEGSAPEMTHPYGWQIGVGRWWETSGLLRWTSPLIVVLTVTSAERVTKEHDGVAVPSVTLHGKSSTITSVIF